MSNFIEEIYWELDSRDWGTVEKIRREFEAHGFPADDIEELVKTLEECQFVDAEDLPAYMAETFGEGTEHLHAAVKREMHLVWAELANDVIIGNGDELGVMEVTIELPGRIETGYLVSAPFVY